MSFRSRVIAGLTVSVAMGIPISAYAAFDMANMEVWDSTTSGYTSNWAQKFVDMNGDGLPDYIRYFMTGSNTGTRVRINLSRAGSGFDTEAGYDEWDNTPTGYGAGWSQDFIDMNGDRLPDYVRSYINPKANANSGNGTQVRVNLNVGGAQFDMANTQVWNNTTAGYGVGWKQLFIDMNGDNLQDQVLYYINQTANANSGNGTQVRVRLNQGFGFGPQQIWDSTTGASYGRGWGVSFVDVNGDGLPDFVRHYITPDTNNGTRVRVNLNTGTGFG